MSYIYKILNKVNGKFYIGSTNNYKRRWYSHKYELNRNTHKNLHLQSAWNKYGRDNFDFIIIEECKEIEQFEREQYYIDLLNACDNKVGYNLCLYANGGGNNKGEDFSMSKYTNKQIIKVKKLIIKGYRNVDISKTTNVKDSTISAIRRCDMWKEVGQEYNELINNIYNEQLQSKQSRISKEDITDDLLEKAYILKKQGIDIKEIHKLLNCNSKILIHPLYIYKSKKEGKKVKQCAICGKDIVVKSNVQKYCKRCAKLKKYNKIA